MKQMRNMESMMTGPRIFIIGKIGFFLVLFFALAACAPSPTVTDSADRPAEVLSPLNQSTVEDGRGRFREIFASRLAIHGGFDGTSEDYLHRLDDEPPSPGIPTRERLAANELRVFIVGGYLGDATPGDVKPYQNSVKRLREEGYRIDYLEISGRGSSSYNATQIATQLRDVDLQPREKLVLMGYSKGTNDILHFLIEHPGEADRVDAVVSLASPVNGTPLADAFPEFLAEFVAKMSGAELGDGGGLASIQRSVQMPWLAMNPPPPEPKYYSLAAYTNRENVSRILRDGWNRLAQVDPRNDSQVIFYDQTIPGAVLLGYANGDHWAIALPFTEEVPRFASSLATRNAYPRAALFESILLYLRETL